MEKLPFSRVSTVIGSAIDPEEDFPEITAVSGKNGPIFLFRFDKLDRPEIIVPIIRSNSHWEFVFLLAAFMNKLGPTCERFIGCQSKIGE